MAAKGLCNLCHFSSNGTKTVIEPRVREILLKWLSDALENSEYTGRTEDGRRFVLDRSQISERCTVHCEDGNFTMPSLSFVFLEEEN